MKGLSLVLFLAMPAVFLGQGVFNNQTCQTLQKVISDYQNNFKNIQGNVVSTDGQSTDFASTVSLPGSESAVITRFNSPPDKNIYSWKCSFGSSEDFSAIAKKYKAVYDQIKNTIIKVDGQKPYILNGTYEAPNEEKKFTTTQFYLLPPSGDMKKLKIDLTLEYFVTEWKMSMIIFDQSEEDAFVKE